VAIQTDAPNRASNLGNFSVQLAPLLVFVWCNIRGNRTNSSWSRLRVSGVFRSSERQAPIVPFDVLLLFAVFLICVGIVEFGSQAMLWRIAGPHLSSFAISIVSFTAFGLGSLLCSRLSLSVPALILDDFKVGQAIFRSGELTRGKWSILAVLLFKSVVGGYIAGMLPFWLARFIPANVQVPSWFGWLLTAASVALVTVVEPVMFIGFALLYLKTSTTPSTTQAQAVHA
jgi:hypothetical protein